MIKTDDNSTNKDIKLNNSPSETIYIIVKRVFDIVIAAIGLVLSAPIVLIFALLVSIETPGMPFYSQERVGKNGKEFQIFKIRSMHDDAERKGAKWAEKNDSRITKVGGFIRKTRIDELPQFLNILRGEMSLIGPRPERRIFIEEFEKDIPNFSDRLMVKPGLTGWAQVNGGYDIDPKEKLTLDLYYIEHMGFKIDAVILFKTVFVIFTGSGAR